MTERIISLVFVTLFLTSMAFADVASELTQSQAQAAASILQRTTTVAHYCSPCGDKAAKQTGVTSVTFKPSSIQGSWNVVLNGKTIDLAYVYIPAGVTWRNLAVELRIPIGSIPAILDRRLLPTGGPALPPNAPGGGTPGKLIEWSPVVEMDKQIFPAFFLATATQEVIESTLEGVKGDAQGKIGAHIVNPKANTRLRLQIQIDPVIAAQDFETVLAQPGKYYKIYPKIVWNWEALKRFRTASPANAKFTLFLDGKLIEQKTVVVRIRSVNEAVIAYSYLSDENRWANTGWLFAAYVNEDHPFIDQLLKEALDLRLVDSFIGYQGKQEQVLGQVYAIWYVLQRRGFRYSSITDTSGTGTTTKVYSQYVRLFDEAIRASQANCVDGTVLIASVLKKIGIRVGLVLIPGHCFLVFDMDGKGNWRGLETTMMGSVDFARFPDIASRSKAAVDGFLAAVSSGNKTLSDSIPKINENDPRYKLIEVDKARKNGIFPLAW